VSGDTYTPPQYKHSTSFESDDVLEFRQRSSENIKPFATVEAERDVQNAYASKPNQGTERALSPIEVASLQTAAIIELRLSRMVNEDKPMLKEEAA
jgi:hypothetical protein